MIKVIWRLPGRQVTSRQGIEKHDPIDESWVFDKENLHITVATKLKLILNLIRQANQADHVDTPWQCDRHQLDSLVIGQVYACEHKPTERPTEVICGVAMFNPPSPK